LEDELSSNIKNSSSK